MTCHSEAHKYVVGIEYDTYTGEMGFFDINRTVTLKMLAQEVAGYLQNGKPYYPAFPPEASPEILFAWDLDDPDDGDIYHELIAEIEALSVTEAA